jgi:hypothetical protein
MAFTFLVCGGDEDFAAIFHEGGAVEVEREKAKLPRLQEAAEQFVVFWQEHCFPLNPSLPS